MVPALYYTAALGLLRASVGPIGRLASIPSRETAVVAAHPTVILSSIPFWFSSLRAKVPHTEAEGSQDAVRRNCVWCSSA